MDEHRGSAPDLLALAGGILLLVGVTRPWFSLPDEEGLFPFAFGLGAGTAADDWRGLPALAGGVLMSVVALGGLFGLLRRRVSALLWGCGVALGAAALLFGLDFRTAGDSELASLDFDLEGAPLALATGFWISAAGIAVALVAAVANAIPRRANQGPQSAESEGPWQDSAPPA